jgi:hypothetical protein
MGMNVAAILIVGAIAYVWLTRGFFSALLHMVCVIAAGAIAFALWEPLGYFLLGRFNTNGMMQGVVWAVSLVFPFAISLAIIRVAFDKLIPWNVAINDIANYIGGGVCGLVSGVITAGILILSISFLRIAPDEFGYQPLAYSPSRDGVGSVQRHERLGWGLFPVDSITVGLYQRLSLASFRTGEPLAKWHPDLDVSGGGMRLNFGFGKARNTLTPRDFQVTAHYIVGEKGGLDAAALVADAWDPRVQKVVDLDGKAIEPKQSHIEGFVIKFNSGAKEKDGKVVMGNGQMWLVAQNSQDETETHSYHPMAVAAQADGADPSLARFRFDGNEVFIASVGGQSESRMGFEFLVPQGFHAIALYIKNVRFDVESGGAPTVQFPDGAARDSWIRSGMPETGGPGTVGAAAGALDTSQVVTVETKSKPTDPISANAGIMVANNTGGWVIMKGNEHGLEVREEDNHIINGEERYNKSELNNRGIDSKLRVDKFAVPRDAVVIQVDVGAASPASLLGPVAVNADTSAPPLIIDTKNQKFDAVGYIYADATEVRIRYTPGRPIRNLNELTQIGITLSRSRPDQSLKLLFRGSLGTEIAYFAIGQKAITQYAPPVPLNMPQK